MTETLRVLLVEDSTTDAKLISMALRTMRASIHLERVDTRQAFVTALGQGEWDVIISDWSLPAFSAPLALSLLQQSGADIPFIIVSGSVGEELAVQAMRAGAHDYVLKANLARLAPAVERELRELAERRAHKQSERALRVAENQLQQMQKMDAIGSLAGGVAHDFNNLLSVILGYSKILSDGLKAGDPMREDLEQIQAAGERAATLTRQLLAFSRQQILQPKVLSINDVVRGLEPMLRRLLGEDVELTVLLASNLGMAELDPGQMEQVIMNLAVNSRDAMPRGGKLTIETGNVELDEHYIAQHPGATPGPHVMLAVTDTGLGMERSVVARMFEPFFTTKEKGKGTGLGLSMVFGIVKQSGGNIWVYSEPGRGTTLKVYFPRTDRTTSTESVSEPAASSQRRGSETILLVEDDDGVRGLTLVILKRQGYHVLEARNGGEALLLCEQHPATIDLVITDVIMPRMSGKQVAERLLAIRPNMKLIYMSGYTDNSIVHHGVLDSGVAFLQKPLRPDALLEKVRTVLDA